MRFRFELSYPVDTVYEGLWDQHVDKFAVNSNYLVVPILNAGLIKVIDANNNSELRSMRMERIGGITNIANFAYTIDSDYFLMQSTENKLFLYDFSTTPMTFIREYPITLQNSKHLLYIKGTNYFISSDNGNSVVIDVRTG